MILFSNYASDSALSRGPALSMRFQEGAFVEGRATSFGHAEASASHPLVLWPELNDRGRETAAKGQFLSFLPSLAVERHASARTGESATRDKPALSPLSLHQGTRWGDGDNYRSHSRRLIAGDHTLSVVA
jgi:hypothetical protein